jgi:hypothetical protein
LWFNDRLSPSSRQKLSEIGDERTEVCTTRRESMWLALLFDDHDELVAAAPAADVAEIGPSYWRDVWARPLPWSSGYSQSELRIDDPELAEALLSLQFDDRDLNGCRQALAAYADKRPLAVASSRGRSSSRPTRAA